MTTDPPPPLLTQVMSRCFDNEERASQIQVHGPVPEIRRHLLYRCPFEDPGGHDHAVDRSERRHRRVHRPLRPPVFGKVGLHCDRPPPDPFHRRDRLTGGVRVRDKVHGNVRARLRREQCRRPPDPARPACDEYMLVSNWIMFFLTAKTPSSPR
jgi:hypothetical protein